MGAYQQLFGIAVEHTFFADHVCKFLQFVPTEATQSFLKKSELLLRATPNGIGVFCLAGKFDVLRSHAADFGGELTLGFKVFSKDPYFTQYTLPSNRSRDVMLCFDNRTLNQGADGGLSLHGGDTVSDVSYRDARSAEVKAMLDTRDQLMRPNFLVQITIVGAGQDLTASGLDPIARNYSIRFAARETLWKYFVMGDLTKKNIYIADLDSGMNFQNMGNTVLPGNRLAMMLVSNSAIPLQEKNKQRFQLRERGSMGEKVLIKRMPNACVSRISREIVDGNGVLVSEIFIN